MFIRRKGQLNRALVLLSLIPPIRQFGKWTSLFAFAYQLREVFEDIDLFLFKLAPRLASAFSHSLCWIVTSDQ